MELEGTSSSIKTFPKRKNKKKESSLHSRRFCPEPKGNGINSWITVAEILVVAGAGYIDEDLFYRFMPEAFGAGLFAAAIFAFFFVVFIHLITYMDIRNRSVAAEPRE
jgi:hypothetical protein